MILFGILNYFLGMIVQSMLRLHASPTTYAPGMTNVTGTPLVAASTRPRLSCPQHPA